MILTENTIRKLVRENLINQNSKKKLLLKEIAPWVIYALAGAAGITAPWALSDTPKVEKFDLAKFVAGKIKVNIKDIEKIFGLNSEIIKKVMLASYSLPAIESGDAKGLSTGKPFDFAAPIHSLKNLNIPVLTSDFYETLYSKSKIKDTSIGITQIKKSSADFVAKKYPKFAKLVNYQGSVHDISGTRVPALGDKLEKIVGKNGSHVKSTLMSFGLLCHYTKEALDMGYAFDYPGQWYRIGDKRHQRIVSKFVEGKAINKKIPDSISDKLRLNILELRTRTKGSNLFKSTGHAALDMAISAYNFGGGVDNQNIFKKIDKSDPKQNYIPRLDSTYTYLRKVRNVMQGSRQRIIQIYDKIDPSEIFNMYKQADVLIKKLKNREEKSIKLWKSLLINPTFDGSAALAFRQWVNKPERKEKLTQVFKKNFPPSMEDLELSLKKSSEGMHFWLAAESFADDWCKSKAGRKYCKRKLSAAEKKQKLKTQKYTDIADKKMMY